MVTLTYGVLPPLEEFRVVYDADHVDTDSGFWWDLQGREAIVAEELGLPAYIRRKDNLTAAGTYELLLTLIAAYESGNQVAGDLASGVMACCGYEWV